MQCYIINLPSKKDRLHRTEMELRRYCSKLQWTVPPMAVAGEWSDEEFNSKYDGRKARRYFRRDLSRGEVACTLSHQSALRAFLDTTDVSAFIVEDDVMLSPAVGEFLEALEKWFITNDSSPICVLLSEASEVRYWAARKWILGFKRTKPLEACGAFAYVVNRRGAEIILSSNPSPIGMVSDNWAYYSRHGLHIYGLNKVLAGSFDFDRTDSSLSAGRAEAAKQSRGLDMNRPFLSRMCRSVRIRVRNLWRILSAVDKSGAIRSNERLYMLGAREGGLK